MAYSNIRGSIFIGPSTIASLSGPMSTANAWPSDLKYIAELMEFGTHQPVDGVFEYPWFDLYWTEHNRFPFWAYVDGERVAFRSEVHRRADGVRHAPAGRWRIRISVVRSLLDRAQSLPFLGLCRRRTRGLPI